MNKNDIHKLIEDQTKGLPDEILLEILDFVEFVKIKKSRPDNIKIELSHLDKQELFHLEEEFLNYKELYPHES